MYRHWKGLKDVRGRFLGREKELLATCLPVVTLLTVTTGDR